MKRLSKEDLAQMNQGYFKSLDKERLVEVAGNLHKLAIEQLEKLEQNSKNSSKPPSSDSLFRAEAEPCSTEEQPTTEIKTSEHNEEDTSGKSEAKEKSSVAKGFGKKPPGKQVGAKGIWRTTPLVPDITVPHYPETCAACNRGLEIDDNAKPHMGYYVLELDKQNSGIQVNCQLHHSLLQCSL